MSIKLSFLICFMVGMWTVLGKFSIRISMNSSMNLLSDVFTPFVFIKSLKKIEVSSFSFSTQSVPNSSSQVRFFDITVVEIS